MGDSMEPETRLFSREETAVYLGTTPRSVDRLVNRGVLVPIRIPGLQRTLFDKQDLERLIESSRPEGQDSSKQPVQAAV
jgi:hypothetical protein